VIHLRRTIGSPTPTDIYGDITSATTQDMWRSVSTDAKILQLAITPLDGTSATQTFSPFADHGAKYEGGATGDTIPAVSALVKATTSARGRSHRGRVYLPFTTEEINTNGQFASSPFAVSLTGWTNWISNLLSTDSKMVVASYKLATASDVQHTVPEPTLATQRRRQGRLRGA
jgi:hypothetical protein